ncbi:hypothetical protein HPP92_018763 [Vanilla planifolia]|uniref:Uncharacterized protein n=1 Tax=Vanilla planifolia TaxID=51239 RepID=A0A835UMP7_VANPL|nr:hypothetical protein HPP92_018763 [Vanilla planifolia]
MFSCKKVLLLSPSFFPLLTQRTFVKTHRHVYPQKFGNFSYFLSHQLLYKLVQFRSQCSISAPSFVIPAECTPQFRALFDVIAVGVGSLEDMENSLEQLNVKTTKELVIQLIHSCTDLPAAASCGRGSYRSRRLLRFFTWCVHRRVISGFDHHVFNSAIRAFARMNDLTAVGIAQLELKGRMQDGFGDFL